MTVLRKFNNWIGDKLAFGLSTMWCFYVVTAFVLLPLIWSRPEGLVGWAQYLVQSLFQGASLPLLGYVARLAGEGQERTLNETHDEVMAELSEIREMHAELHQLVKGDKSS